jgi:hypothetical protein
MRNEPIIHDRAFHYQYQQMFLFSTEDFYSIEDKAEFGFLCCAGL